MTDPSQANFCHFFQKISKVFIHRILLDLSLDDFPAFEPVHLIAPIGATFLRQRAAQMRASFKHPRVESSSSVAPPPFSKGDPSTEV